MIAAQTRIKLLIGATVLCFAALWGLSVLYLQPEGMLIFDSRVGGYDVSVAQTYLAALEETGGAAVYQGLFRGLDTLFPALLLACLLVFFRRMAQGVSRFVLYGISVAYLVADFAENMFVARLLALGSNGITQADVTPACMMTQLKWALLVLAVLVGVFLRFKRGRS